MLVINVVLPALPVTCAIINSFKVTKKIIFLQALSLKTLQK